MLNTNISFLNWCFCDVPNEILGNIPLHLKRGLSDITKFTLSAFFKLDLQKNYPLVFSTQHGNWQQVFKIIKQLNEEDIFSPLIFSKLSNNISPGIISILTLNNHPYTTISAGDKSFEMGLLESIIQENEDVIFIYAEEVAQDPFGKIENAIPGAFAVHISKTNSGKYFFSHQNKSEIKTKTVFDFMKFLKTDIDVFETSNFIIKKGDII